MPIPAEDGTGTAQVLRTNAPYGAGVEEEEGGEEEDE